MLRLSMGNHGGVEGQINLNTNELFAFEQGIKPSWHYGIYTGTCLGASVINYCQIYNAMQYF